MIVGRTPRQAKWHGPPAPSLSLRWLPNPSKRTKDNTGGEFILRKKAAPGNSFEGKTRNTGRGGPVYIFSKFTPGRNNRENGAHDHRNKTAAPNNAEKIQKRRRPVMFSKFDLKMVPVMPVLRPLALSEGWMA
jgi:hypothetical protein